MPSLKDSPQFLFQKQHFNCKIIFILQIVEIIYFIYRKKSIILYSATQVAYSVCCSAQMILAYAGIFLFRHYYKNKCNNMQTCKKPRRSLTFRFCPYLPKVITALSEQFSTNLMTLRLIPKNILIIKCCVI